MADRAYVKIDFGWMASVLLESERGDFDSSNNFLLVK